jgi:hypothetical protein
MGRDELVIPFDHSCRRQAITRRASLFSTQLPTTSVLNRGYFYAIHIILTFLKAVTPIAFCSTEHNRVTLSSAKVRRAIY